MHALSQRDRQHSPPVADARGEPRGSAGEGTMNDTTVVVGLGEVGEPLLELVERAGGAAFGVDVDPSALPKKTAIDVMHVCFPYQIDDFVGEVTRYSNLLEPALTIINSTVAVGTTR